MGEVNDKFHKTKELRGNRMSQKAKWYRRIGPFLKEVRAEMKKVTWPSRNEVYSTTIVVIIATLFFGFYLYFMDLIFSWAISRIQSIF